MNRLVLASVLMNVIGVTFSVSGQEANPASIRPWSEREFKLRSPAIVKLVEEHSVLARQAYEAERGILLPLGTSLRQRPKTPLEAKVLENSKQVNEIRDWIDQQDVGAFWEAIQLERDREIANAWVLAAIRVFSATKEQINKQASKTVQDAIGKLLEKGAISGRAALLAATVFRPHDPHHDVRVKLFRHALEHCRTAYERDLIVAQMGASGTAVESDGSYEQWLVATLLKIATTDPEAWVRGRALAGIGSYATCARLHVLRDIQMRDNDENVRRLASMAIESAQTRCTVAKSTAAADYPVCNSERRRPFFRRFFRHCH